MTTPTYTEHRYTQPDEHTLYPRPQHRYECSECGAVGYHYPDKGEVWTYHACITFDRVTPGDQHVWVYEDTMATQGTGDRVFTPGTPGEPSGTWTVTHVSGAPDPGQPRGRVF